MITAFSSTPQPMIAGRRSFLNYLTVKVFVLVPFAALLAAIPFAWGWGLGWADIGLAILFYLVSGFAITVGYHRLFTHRSFKAKRALRISLAIAGSLAVQGSVVPWVADHRRHHAFSDRAGDPHSPWLYGTSPWALAKGFWHAHLGWMFERDKTNVRRFAPDLESDRDIQVVDRFLVLWIGISLGAPALLGGLITWSWWGALTAFFWAGLVRISFLHHTTWSVNSICHLVGARPFHSKDKAANFWPLAILSLGESWHNSHHADPTCARHGVQRGQLDCSARLIWLFEKLGWVWDVRWPRAQRFAKLATTPIRSIKNAS